MEPICGWTARGLRSLRRMSVLACQIYNEPRRVSTGVRDADASDFGKSGTSPGSSGESKVTMLEETT